MANIARATSCRIGVNCPDGKSPKYKFFPISITVTSRYDMLPILERLDEATEKLLELLLYFLDVKCDVGAKGRLTYDVESSYSGPHLPRESTSNAVEWKGPNGPGFLSLIELAFAYRDGRKDFYSHMIAQACESLRMKSLGCLVKVYGDAGVPLKFCDPYALVSGASWQAVDEAVEIVQAFIKRDQNQPPPQLLPPSEYKNPMLLSQAQPPSIADFSRQISIPVEEYPTKQLMGLLIGKQGCTRRDLENRFGCRIEILGKGTTGRNGYPYDKDKPPHALVTGDNHASVDAASKMIESMIKERIESDDSTATSSVVRIKLPLWLQQDRQAKEDLFCKTFCCFEPLFGNEFLTCCSLCSFTHILS